MYKIFFIFLLVLSSCSTLSNSVNTNIQASTSKNIEKDKAISFIDSDYTFRGNKDAKNIVVEYLDFKCSHCAHSKTNLEKLLVKYPTQVKVVYKHYPFINETSNKLAYLFERVSLENKEKALNFYDYVFEHQTEINTDTDLKNLEKQYTTRELTKTEDEKIIARIKKDKAEADSLGISGTPLFVINNKDTLRGYLPENEFLDAVSKLIN